MLTKQDIVTAIKALDLPPDAYWVCAGAGLVLHGVKEVTRDIDIGCTAAVIDTLLERGVHLVHTKDGERKVAYGDVLEFFEDWRVDDVIDIGGISVATLGSIRKQKLMLGREKDFEDIKLIDAYLER